MASSEILMKSRANAKRALTRLLTHTRELLLTDKVVEINTNDLIDAMQTFTISHDAYVDYACDNDPLFDVDVSDEYYHVKQVDYIDVMTQIHDEKRRHAAPPPHEQVLQVPAVETSLRIDPPKPPPFKFDGDLMCFHVFMSAFDSGIGKLTDGTEKLNILIEYTVGSVNHAIRGCAIIGGQEGYEAARSILFDRWGDDEKISRAIYNSLTKGPIIKTARGLQTLADDVKMAHITLRKMRKLDEFSQVNQELILKTGCRLSRYHQNRWRSHALDFKERTGRYPDFSEFTEFIRRAARDACDPVYGAEEDGQCVSKHTPQGSNKVAQTYSVTVNQQKEATPSKHMCPKCNSEHRLYVCAQFKSLDSASRHDFVRCHQLCGNCLLGNHTTDTCQSPATCRVCDQRHNTLLHDKPTTQVSEAVASVSSNFSNTHTQAIMLPVMRVKVNDTYEVNILIDTGSTHSFVTSSLVKTMGLKGTKASLQLQTLNGSENRAVAAYSFKLTGTLKNLYVSRPYEVDHIPVPNVKLKRAYPHLQDISVVEDIDEVNILLGQDCCQALIPLEVRTGPAGSPYAVRTMLGWYISGPTDIQSHPPLVCANFVNTSVDLQMLWNVDQEGLDASSDAKLSLSDMQVLYLWEKNLTIVNDRIQLPIPWLAGMLRLPNNLSLAHKKLINLTGRLNRLDLYQKYDDVMKAYLCANHAEKVPCDELKLDDGSVWYLAHHHVMKKDGVRIRIIHDCSSEYRGTALNKQCHQGPDFNNALFNVLLRFREHKYVALGDIEGMYMQILIPPHQRNALRFLWYDDDGAITHYRMTRHVFGGIWCASTAVFALQKTCDLRKTSSEARDAIMKSFYVDDLLVSHNSKGALTRLITEVRSVLKSLSFNLTKMITNDAEVLNAIPQDIRADFSRSTWDTKTLGVDWSPDRDVFIFSFPVVEIDPITKRSILKTVTSIYDPLGMVSPVTLMGRVILQDVTKLDLGWDDKVPPDIAVRWIQWMKSLQDATVEVPRCLVPSHSQFLVHDLHYFCDGSTIGYGSVVYLRSYHTATHKVVVSFITSKARVAPLKTITIPRMELSAALLSTKIHTNLVKELTIDISSVTFWSDSQVALAYIRGDSKRYHTYVANRIMRIRDVSQPTNWRYVPGTENPADIASRGVYPTDIIDSDWFSGPDFLSRNPDTWPKDEKFEGSSDDTELKPAQAHVINVEVAPIFLDHLMESKSNLFRIKKVLARVLQFISRCRRVRGTHIRDEIDKAQRILVRHSQRGLDVKSFAKFAPFTDQDGILRVGGRTRTGVTQPIILSRCRLSELLIAECHSMNCHMRLEYTLADLRAQGWWITRRQVKLVLSKCAMCKRYFAQPHNQKMANLPETRVQPSPPFTHTGLDAFGPFIVKVRRSDVKRWGCIFTCFSTRAIHIEVLSSMDTNAFLNSLMRFIARRGKPHTITSDNGGNFTHGNGELRAAIDRWNQSQIEDRLMQRNIKWTFNPPYSSHRGGVWERHIRTIRKILCTVLSSQRITDDTLHTAMVLAEEVINNRPITKVSDDPMDISVLRPRDLLLSASTTTPVPETFSADHYKGSWKQAQYLVDQFWIKWIRHYLPELQARSKWLNEKPNPTPGDVVLVYEPNVHRNFWPLALITDVVTGDDGLVRTVKVKLGNHESSRAINKVVPLEASGP